MGGLTQEELKEFIRLMQKMNLKQIQKAKEVINEVEKDTAKLIELLKEFDALTAK